MDSRAARREAEKAARVLIAGKVEIIGDLAVASAARATAVDGIKSAKEQGKMLVEQAKKQSAELVSAARERVEDAEVEYGAVFTVAVSTGWTAKELVDLGYEPTVRTTHKRPTVKKAAPLLATVPSDGDQVIDPSPSFTAPFSEQMVREGQPV